MSATRVLALVLLALAAGIAQRQAAAASCPRHRRLAGALATVLALACVAAAVWLGSLDPG